MNGSTKYKIIGGLLLLAGTLFAGWSQFNMSGNTDQLVLEDAFVAGTTTGQTTGQTVESDATVVNVAAAPKASNVVPLAPPPRRRSSEEEVTDSTETIEVNAIETQESNTADATSEDLESTEDLESDNEFVSNEEATVPVSINRPEESNSLSGATEIPDATKVADDPSTEIEFSDSSNEPASEPIELELAGSDSSETAQTELVAESVTLEAGDAMETTTVKDEDNVDEAANDSLLSDRHADPDEALEKETPVVHKLHNPTTLVVSFLISGVEHQLAPGEAIEFTPGVVRYHRGGSFGDKETQVEQGFSYAFSVSRANGWAIDKTDN